MADNGWLNARGGIRVAMSHRMAAVLHSYVAEAEAIDRLVDVNGRPIRPVRGVRVHRTLLGDGEAVTLTGVPVTSAARTIVDLAVDATSRELERALATGERAEFHGDARAFQRDHERDRMLAQAGYQVLRLSWHQLTTDVVCSAAALAATIARLEKRERQRS